MDWLNLGCSQPVNVNGQVIEVVTLQGFECLFKIALNIVFRLAGVLVFIMLLVGGFKYLTAGGNQEKIAAAGKTITYAIAGLVLMILVWFIFLFIREFTGIDVTIFQMPR